MDYQTDGSIKREKQQPDNGSQFLLNGLYTHQLQYNNNNNRLGQQQQQLDCQVSQIKKPSFENHSQQELISTSNQQHMLYTDCATDPVDVEPFDSASKLAPTKRGSLQLWQFLLHLLETKDNESMIEWTRKSAAEFKLHEPEKVACRWGVQKNRPTMNYDKLSRSLRYYYEKGIMQKVSGERYVYRFINHDEVNKYLNSNRSVFKFPADLAGNKEPTSDASAPVFLDSYVAQNAQTGIIKRPKGIKRLARPSGSSSCFSSKKHAVNGNEMMRYSPYARPANGQHQSNSMQEPISSYQSLNDAKLHYNQQLYSLAPTAGCYYNNFNLAISPTSETSFKPVSVKKEISSNYPSAMTTTYSYNHPENKPSSSSFAQPSSCEVAINSSSASSSLLHQSSYSTQSINCSSPSQMSHSSSSVLDAASPKATTCQGAYYSPQAATPSTPNLFNHQAAKNGFATGDYSMIHHHSYQAYSSNASSSFNDSAYLESSMSGLNQSTSQPRDNYHHHNSDINKYPLNSYAYASSPYYLPKQHDNHLHHNQQQQFYKMPHPSYLNQQANYIHNRHHHHQSLTNDTHQYYVQPASNYAAKPSNDQAAIKVGGPHSPPASLSTLNLSSVSSSSSSSCYNTNESDLSSTSSSNYY